MTSEREQLFVVIHDLATRLLDGTATPTERERLERLVGDSPEARRLFAAYMQETALLKWQHGHPGSEILDDLANASRVQPGAGAGWWIGSRAVRIVAAVAAAIGLVAMTYALRLGPAIRPHVPFPPAASGLRRADRLAADGPASAAKAGVATLTRCAGVAWTAAERPELSRLEAGDVLRFDRGEVEMVFDSGVEVRLRGPAEFEVRGADYAVNRLGTVSARVGDDGRGFTIETPAARVVDLGTEFGVDVSRSGVTEVVVFRGLVDLSVSRAQAASPRRLRQGEGLRVDPDGSLDRVTTISSDRFPVSIAPPRTAVPVPVIDAVHDNNASGSRKFYRIVRSGLREDSQAFVDRNHQWNGTTAEGMPGFLEGAEYVMPYNDDKFADHLQVSVSLARPATLYVLYSDSLDVPEWLRRDFVDTGCDVGLDEAKNRFLPDRQSGSGAGVSIDTVFSVWRRDVPAPMTVTLGAVPVPANRAGYNMYGIAAMPLEPTAEDEEAEADAGDVAN